MATAAPAGARWTFIPDLLQEHLEELGFLWGQWRSGLRSPEETPRGRHDLEERIRARLQGVLAVADHRGLPLIEEGLESEDPDVAFAAAFSLLHLGDESLTSRVLAAFASAEEDRLGALAQALAHGPLREELPRIWSLLDAGDPRLAVAAAEVLAFQGALKFTPEQLRRFLQEEDAQVRRDGWRLVGYLGADVEPKAYAAAMRDDDVAVRAAALEAGAWGRVEGVLTVARQLARVPAPDHLEAYHLLAVLGAPGDLPLVAGIAQAESLGPARFRPVGAYGSPALLDWILAELENPDPATAAAAGAAFTKLTGEDVESDRRAQVLPAGEEEPDEFEAEFLDEVTLPDPALARRRWTELAPRLADAGRICRGVDVGQPIDAESFDSLDMESRRQLYLRSRFYGGWNGSPLSLEIFPQPG